MNPALQWRCLISELRSGLIHEYNVPELSSPINRRRFLRDVSREIIHILTTMEYLIHFHPGL